MVYEKEKLNFQDLNLSNIETLVMLINETNQEKWTNSALRHLVLKGSGAGFILFDSLKPIGFCLSRYLSGEAEILSIGVLAQYRKKGMGIIIVNKLEEFFLKNNISKCFLEVNELNKPAVSFYKKLGFIYIKTLNKYYRGKNKHENGLLLQKLYN